LDKTKAKVIIRFGQNQNLTSPKAFDLQQLWVCLWMIGRVTQLLLSYTTIYLILCTFFLNI